MNYPTGTSNDPSAPWNEADHSHLFECDDCHKILNKFEDGDPCEIDGRTLCDSCASDLTYLRMNNIITKVSIRTKKLK